MSDEQPPGESGWVVEPGVEIRIAVGREAELTPEIQAAIDDVLRALEAAEATSAEVEGFGKCGVQCKAPGYGLCNPQAECQPKVWMPCANKVSCHVADFA
jgi:hypothetical protein